MDFGKLLKFLHFTEVRRHKPLKVPPQRFWTLGLCNTSILFFFSRSVTQLLRGARVLLQDLLANLPNKLDFLSNWSAVSLNI